MANPTKQAKSKTPVNASAAAHAGAPAVPATLPAMEPSAAEAAFQSLALRYCEIEREQLAPVNVDVQTTAVFALGVSRFVSEPAVRARFGRLGNTGEYDAACVDDLAVAAQAAWYARHRYMLAMAIRSEAQVPLPLVDAAFALRGRLLRLAEYWLSDDAAAAAELAAIRAGSGYQDLANDLVALAAVCERHRPLLSQDRKLYQAGDAGEAKRLSGQILEQLGTFAVQEQDAWTLAQARAWTHLAATYDEVRRGGRFLFSVDEAETRFPSLVTVARAAASRSPKEEAAAPGNGASAKGVPASGVAANGVPANGASLSNGAAAPSAEPSSPSASPA